MKYLVPRAALFIFAAALMTPAHAELNLSSIFSDHMVLQQKQPIRVWGWTAAAQEVTVELAEQSVAARADADGRFELNLEPVAAGGPYTLTVKADETKTFEDVLVGEVWLCAGQSNMSFPVAASNDPDLESLSANFPSVRLISVPQVGTQEPQNDFNGQWEKCTPETVKNFSAVGYFFGRQLHQTLGVPVGLIDNAWGGSSCEAWVKRDLLEDDELYGPLMERWKNTEATYNHETAVATYKEKLKEWKANKKGAQPRVPRNQLIGQHRPANLYNGVLKPILGYTIKGSIWYQGETNAGRAYQYRDLFPLMIQSWRDEWNQGDFSFYWVQLADFRAEVAEPTGSAWAELREAQTMTMSKLPNTGEAVILNLGEAVDIHPKNKQDVAKRLARWALAKDYGVDLVFQSPLYDSMEVADGKVQVHFESVGGGLDLFDIKEPVGFAIAGSDEKFVEASAKIVDKNTIEVWTDGITEPVAVRYAWADNPVCNLQSAEGLPVTPFRTDTWPGLTAEAK